jgi:hypothetical protein
MDGLLHRGHADRSLKQVGLGEFTLDQNGQALIQRCDRTSTTFFGFEMAVLTAGCSLPLGERQRERLQSI